MNKFYFALQLLEDPIFIPINQLEQNKKNQPEEFSVVEKAMRAGKQGSLRIEKAPGGKPRVSVYYFHGAI